VDFNRQLEWQQKEISFCKQENDLVDLKVKLYLKENQFPQKVQQEEKLCVNKAAENLVVCSR
jgi:hypothetical protein